MDKIFLHGMKFYAYHGVFEEENKLGQIFVVDTELSLDLTEASETDALDTTVNYGEVFHIIEEEMKEPSQLLEHVAGRIAKKLFAHYNRVVALTIRITKENPPIVGHYDGVGIEIHRAR